MSCEQVIEQGVTLKANVKYSFPANAFTDCSRKACEEDLCLGWTYSPDTNTCTLFQSPKHPVIPIPTWNIYKSSNPNDVTGFLQKAKVFSWMWFLVPFVVIEIVVLICTPKKHRKRYMIVVALLIALKIGLFVYWDNDCAKRHKKTFMFL